MSAHTYEYSHVRKRNGAGTGSAPYSFACEVTEWPLSGTAIPRLRLGHCFTLLFRLCPYQPPTHALSPASRLLSVTAPRDAAAQGQLGCPRFSSLQRRQSPMPFSRSTSFPHTPAAPISSVLTMPAMKSFIASALAALAIASSPSEDMEIQVGITAHDFIDHGCRDIVVLFARGSLEAGNLGTICGPATAQGLKDRFGADKVAVEGIEYKALLESNYSPGGADPGGISEMKRLIANVTDNCPGSMLLVGGYSQGAALTHRAVENLCQAQKNKVTAAFTFGDTQNAEVSIHNSSRQGPVAEARCPGSRPDQQLSGPENKHHLQR